MSQTNSKRSLLLGDEAIGLGAIHAGMGAAYGYPGTPSTEIMEYLLHEAGKNGSYHATWCTNEKTAYEQALGASMVGKRAIVTMKHVGLNVAADPFMSSSLISIHGGLVLAVADDPGMHSSQNEQDSRFFADFARIPCLEPATQQEAYDMVREAFELSESLKIPVMLRVVTRLAHGRGVVQTRAATQGGSLKKPPQSAPWILLPSNARRQWHERILQAPALQARTESSPFNTLKLNETLRDYGVITTGTARGYFLEALEELSPAPSHLHIGEYPFPTEKVRALASRVRRIIVLEEGYPLVERMLRGVLVAGTNGPSIEGKLSGLVPPEGELTPDLVRKALGLPVRKGVTSPTGALPGRPPQLCPGCPHTDSYGSLKLALQGFEQKLVTGDIGCYTLGAMPEHAAIESCVCMGASISMAKGAADAGLYPVVAVIGDSTFYHSGMTSLVDAISANTNMTVMIVDNETVGMTGGQTTILPSSGIKDVVLGLGVNPEHVHVVTTHRKFLEENAKLIRKELEYKGLSVVILVRECIETAKRNKAVQAVEQSV